MSAKKNNKKRGITRRDFIKWSAAAGAAGKALDWSVVPAGAHQYRDINHTETKTVCPYCSVGCGMTVAVDDATGDVIDIYGDSDHVISRGALCSKGSAAIQLQNSPERLGAGTKRPPGCNEDGPWKKVVSGTTTVWQDYGGATAEDRWNNAMTDIATGIVAARGSITKAGENKEGIAFLGSAHMTIEENYVYRKLIANLGTNNIEHQARI